eukprot:3800487-Pyramimonas_sp.AAC.1
MSYGVQYPPRTCYRHSNHHQPLFIHSCSELSGSPVARCSTNGVPLHRPSCITRLAAATTDDVLRLLFYRCYANTNTAATATATKLYT